MKLQGAPDSVATGSQICVTVSLLGGSRKQSHKGAMRCQSFMTADSAFSAQNVSDITIRGVQYRTTLTELSLFGMGLSDEDIVPMQHMKNLIYLRLDAAGWFSLANLTVNTVVWQAGNSAYPTAVKKTAFTDRNYNLRFSFRSPVFLLPIMKSYVNFSVRNPLAPHKKLILSPKSV